MSTDTRILLADDHALVRRGVRLILDDSPGLRVVAEASDGAEAVTLARAEDVDLAILDVAMPRLTGLQAAREIASREPHPRMLMLSMYDNEQYFFEALKAGASGYVLKSVADQDLVEACHAAVRGESFLYPGVVSALARSYLDRIRRRRLAMCRRDLESALLADRQVTEIAGHWGFDDPSQFSKLFRAAFGMSASDCRAQARALAHHNTDSG